MARLGQPSHVGAQRRRPTCVRRSRLFVTLVRRYVPAARYNQDTILRSLWKPSGTGSIAAAMHSGFPPIVFLPGLGSSSAFFGLLCIDCDLLDGWLG